jgi:hypothetical protein
VDGVNFLEMCINLLLFSQLEYILTILKFVRNFTKLMFGKGSMVKK